MNSGLQPGNWYFQTKAPGDCANHCLQLEGPPTPRLGGPVILFSSLQQAIGIEWTRMSESFCNYQRGE